MEETLRGWEEGASQRRGCGSARKPQKHKMPPNNHFTWLILSFHALEQSGDSFGPCVEWQPRHAQ